MGDERGGVKGLLNAVLTDFINVIKLLVTSMMAQWLKHCVSIAGGMGLIRGWGTKIPHAIWCSQKTK